MILGSLTRRGDKIANANFQTPKKLQYPSVNAVAQVGEFRLSGILFGVCDLEFLFSLAAY